MQRIAMLMLLSAALLPAQNVIVIENGTIHTVTKGTFQGSILIRDGLIAEVGGKILTPPGAKIVDATGKHIIPGIVDCHTHIGLDAINEMSLSVTSMVDVTDVVNPEQMNIYRALAGGITTANSLHGSANSIGGENVVIKMRWGQNAAGLIMKEAKPSLKIALGENPKRAGNPVGGPNSDGPQNARYPATRMGVEDVIRDAFSRAKLYQAEWKDYEAKRARGETALPPRRDLQLDPLVEVLEGKRLVHVHCYRADEILMVLRIGEEFGFKITTLQHVLEGYKVAKEIVAHGSSASTFSDWWSYKVEAFDAIPYNAAIMQKKGVLVSLNSDDIEAELMRRLNTEAAKVMKYGGLTEDEALAMITINPARQMQIDRYVGSIETGKQADIVIYDKNPLSMYAKVEKVFIDGKQYFDRDSDLTERPKKEALKKGLLDKEKAEKAKEDEKKDEKKPAPQTRRPS